MRNCTILDNDCSIFCTVQTIALAQTGTRAHTRVDERSGKGEGVAEMDIGASGQRGDAADERERESRGYCCCVGGSVTPRVKPKRLGNRNLNSPNEQARGSASLVRTSQRTASRTKQCRVGSKDCVAVLPIPALSFGHSHASSALSRRQPPIKEKEMCYRRIASTLANERKI